LPKPNHYSSKTLVNASSYSKTWSYLTTPTYSPLTLPQFGYDAETLIAALHIVFHNNLLSLKTNAKQKSGTAMGKRPAPPWATPTLFFGIKVSGLCSNKGSLKEFEDNLLFYKRYLDDILAIWLAHPGMEWTITEPTKTYVIFMDMSLSIVGDK